MLEKTYAKEYNKIVHEINIIAVFYIAIHYFYVTIKE